MLELASLGAQVLNNRSVELAKKYNVELEVLSSLNPVPGTVVKEVVKDVEGMLIKGVAKDTDVAVITILNVPDEPGTSFKIFGLLAQKNINVDIILQSTGRDGKKDISFTCSEGEADLAMRWVRDAGGQLLPPDYTAEGMSLTAEIRTGEADNLRQRLSQIHTLRWQDNYNDA